jgi:hypothetical protein
MTEEIKDPLKALSEVYKPDVRQANLVGDLSDIHSVLTEIVLHDGVPSNVRQLFETAKTVSLYSWFAYVSIKCQKWSPFPRWKWHSESGPKTRNLLRMVKQGSPVSVSS